MDTLMPPTPVDHLALQEQGKTMVPQPMANQPVLHVMDVLQRIIAWMQGQIHCVVVACSWSLMHRPQVALDQGYCVAAWMVCIVAILRVVNSKGFGRAR